jgi:hypothetical protein
MKYVVAVVYLGLDFRTACKRNPTIIRKRQHFGPCHEVLTYDKDQGAAKHLDNPPREVSTASDMPDLSCVSPCQSRKVGTVVHGCNIKKAGYFSKPNY